jgi:hypothetical protein
MALTKGFKKFVGLIAVVAIVGGGIYGYKQYSKLHSQAVDPGVDVSSSTNSPQTSGINYALPASQPEVAQTPQPVEQAPKTAAASTQDTAPSSSGMAALLKAGQK